MTVCAHDQYAVGLSFKIFADCCFGISLKGFQGCTTGPFSKSFRGFLQLSTPCGIIGYDEDQM